MIGMFKDKHVIAQYSPIPDKISGYTTADNLNMDKISE